MRGEHQQRAPEQESKRSAVRRNGGSEGTSRQERPLPLAPPAPGPSGLARDRHVQGLGRDASDVEAGSSGGSALVNAKSLRERERPIVRERRSENAEERGSGEATHLQAELGGLDGSNVASGSCRKASRRFCQRRAVEGGQGHMRSLCVPQAVPPPQRRRAHDPHSNGVRLRQRRTADEEAGEAAQTLS